MDKFSKAKRSEIMSAIRGRDTLPEIVVRKWLQTEECPRATAPKTNRAFWNAKFRANVRRDQEHEKLWMEKGWNVIVIWECGLKTVADRERTFAKLSKCLTELGNTLRIS